MRALLKLCLGLATLIASFASTHLFRKATQQNDPYPPQSKPANEKIEGGEEEETEEAKNE